MSDLKPCPFCGASKAAVDEFRPSWDARSYTAYCWDGCGAEISRPTEAEAITAWNTRTKDAGDDR